MTAATSSRQQVDVSSYSPHALSPVFVLFHPAEMLQSASYVRFPQCRILVPVVFDILCLIQRFLRK